MDERFKQAPHEWLLHRQPNATLALNTISLLLNSLQSNACYVHLSIKGFPPDSLIPESLDRTNDLFFVRIVHGVNCVRSVKVNEEQDARPSLGEMKVDILAWFPLVEGQLETGGSV